MLLQACEVLRRRYVNFKVLIVGGGRDLPPLQREAHERGLADMVIFTGEISHDQIAAYYAMLDVFGDSAHAQPRHRTGHADEAL